MNPHVRTAILIVAAMTASAIVLTMSIGLIRNVTVYSKGPADFLPKDLTHAVLFAPSKTLLQEGAVLQNVHTEEAEAIALLPTSDDHYASVVFIKNNDADKQTIGTYSIISSDMRVLSLVQEYQKPLTSDTRFTTLKAQTGPHTSWGYFTTDILETDVPLLRRTLRALLLAGKDAFSLQHTDRGFVVEHSAENHIRHTADTTIPAMRDAFVRISMGDGHASFLALLDNMPPQDALVFEGLIRTPMSVRYDLLPLLEEPASLQLSASGGSLALLVSGSSTDRITRNRTFDRLHAAHKDTLPASKITKRILDKRFSSIDIRHDESDIEEQSMTRDGWSIRSTAERGSTNGLCTATRGAMFFISSSCDHILHALQHRYSFTHPLSKSDVIAQIDLQAISPILPYLPFSQTDLFATFGTGTLQYISRNESVLRSVSLESSKNPLQLLDILNK